MKNTKRKHLGMAPAYILGLINVKRYFNNIIYPVTKTELIEYLHYQEAPIELIRIFSRLPYAVYASFFEINDALMKRYFVEREDNSASEEPDGAATEPLEPNETDEDI